MLRLRHFHSYYGSCKKQKARENRAIADTCNSAYYTHHSQRAGTFFGWLNVFMIDILFATGYPGLIFTPDTFSLASIIELILPALILIGATMNQIANKKHKDTPKCHPTP